MPSLTNPSPATRRAFSAFAWPWRRALTGLLIGVAAHFAEAADPISTNELRSLALAEQDFAQEKPIEASSDAGKLFWVRSQSLLRFGRLVPTNLPPAELDALVAELRKGGDSADESAWAEFPLADKLAFDGADYRGANLEFIDSILGQTGRPIAFDREVPSYVVPIGTDMEPVLTERQKTFQGDKEAASVRTTTQGLFGEAASTLLFGDGQYLRPYCGRFDDLYFYLYQNGKAETSMAFAALLDGLGERGYRTIEGVGPAKALHPLRFDLNDILSAGGKQAILAHQASSDSTITPFRGFSFCVMPRLMLRTHTLHAGDRLVATAADVQAALRVQHHWYPTRVPPLYRSADRFLGWAGSFFIPVANKVPLPPEAADNWFPLPKEAERRSGSKEQDAKFSDQLFHSDAAPDFVWEDPQQSNLLADPAASSKSAGSGKNANDPRLRPAPARLVAIVTPTVAETQEYFAAIDGNDTHLREIEKLRGRARLLQVYFADARTTLAANTAAKPAGALMEALEADGRWLAGLEEKLDAETQQVLEERANVRSALSGRLFRERVKPLQVSPEAPSAKPATGADPGETLPL